MLVGDRASLGCGEQERESGQKATMSFAGRHIRPYAESGSEEFNDGNDTTTIKLNLVLQYAAFIGML